MPLINFPRIDTHTIFYLAENGTTLETTKEEVEEGNYCVYGDLDSSCNENMQGHDYLDMSGPGHSDQPNLHQLNLIEMKKFQETKQKPKPPPKHQIAPRKNKKPAETVRAPVDHPGTKLLPPPNLPNNYDIPYNQTEQFEQIYSNSEELENGNYNDENIYSN